MLSLSLRLHRLHRAYHRRRLYRYIMPIGKQIINTLQLDVVDPIVVRCPDVDCAELVVIIELTIDVT